MLDCILQDPRVFCQITVSNPLTIEGWPPYNTIRDYVVPCQLLNFVSCNNFQFILTFSPSHKKISQQFAYIIKKTFGHWDGN